MKPHTENASKKAYASPLLTVYGNIRVMTQASGPVGMGDGGMAGTAKTA